MKINDLINFFNEETSIPLRKNVGAIVKSCDEATDSIPDSALKVAVSASYATQIIYEPDVFGEAGFVRIIVETSFKVRKPIEMEYAQEFFASKYHVCVDVIAISFDKTYKIIFTANTERDFKSYGAALEASLKIAFPNATVKTDETNNTIHLKDNIVS